ncbi:hypothetical protein BZA77DRAFT_168864 [Pyronema omphalodes]|nr:hypothetical protein BZA77DRAFT_168864 [Pyronema omphalodes]
MAKIKNVRRPASDKPAHRPTQHSTPSSVIANGDSITLSGQPMGPPIRPGVHPAYVKLMRQSMQPAMKQPPRSHTATRSIPTPPARNHLHNKVQGQPQAPPSGVNEVPDGKDAIYNDFGMVVAWRSPEPHTPSLPQHDSKVTQAPMLWFNQDSNTHLRVPTLQEDIIPSLTPDLKPIWTSNSTEAPIIEPKGSKRENFGHLGGLYQSGSRERDVSYMAMNFARRAQIDGKITVHPRQILQQLPQEGHPFSHHVWSDKRSQKSPAPGVRESEDWEQFINWDQCEMGNNTTTESE